MYEVNSGGLMKRNKLRNIFNILILIIILAFLSIYYLFRQVPESKKNEGNGKVFIVQNIPEFEIEGFDITYNDGTNIYRTLLEKSSNDWAVSFPIKDRADEESVRRIINDLSGLKSEYVITNGEGKFHDFGFDNPVCRIKVLLNNKKDREIILGGKVATEDMYYTITEGNSNTIYMVYRYKFNSIMKTPDDFRSREIFTIPIQDLKEFEIRASDGKLYKFNVIYTNGQQFFLTLPKQLKASNFPVKSKIMDIYSLSISRFIKNSPDETELRFMAWINLNFHHVFYRRIILLMSYI